jgi:arsenate reductase (thioredoxin)
MRKHRVLFLCTGNSCRSQMAEAMTNHELGEQWEAQSAGSKPAGYVHPLALQVLAEIGIQHHGSSKSMETFKKETFDLVITVCADDAENCPVWLGPGKKLHLPFPDPASADGSEAEKMLVFRRVRDEMHTRIIPALNQFVNERSD